MYDPAGTNTGHSDWIELYNPSHKKITIKKEDFGLIDEKDLKLGSDGKHYLNCHGIKEDLMLENGNYLILADDKSDFEIDYPDVAKSKIIDTILDLSSSGDYIRLSNNKCETFFAEMKFENSWGGEDNGCTLEKIKLSSDFSKDNWQPSYILGGTPGEKNSEKPEIKDYSEKIRINEILPNPKEKETENEYIELYNFDDKSIDLENWVLKDSSKTGKYIFPKGSEIKPNNYLVVYRKDYKFSLNNSGSESVFLFNPNEEEISKAAYSGGKEDASYNYDGKNWRWSCQDSPGKGNEFDSVPVIEIKKDKEIYNGAYVEFQAKISNSSKDNKLKFTWDFGDGHKSYLDKTSHIYEKAGKYQGSLKISTCAEDIMQDFTVDVKKYPQSDIKIVGLSANPSGRDTENEWILLLNNSKKKINLKGWSVATGWENLYNHPISKDFEIEKGKSKKLTRDFSVFTLNNKKTKIELRYPNGKVASKLKYDKGDESVGEEELYQKEGDEWLWIGSQNDIETPPNNIEINNIESAEDNSEDQVESIGKDINPEEIGKQSSDGSKEELQNKMLNYNLPNLKLSKINRQLVLGASIVKSDLNFHFTGGQVEEHYTVIFFKKLFAIVNYWLNKLINNLNIQSI